MSFSIRAGGTKEQTLKKLKESQGHGDTTHHDAIRDALVKAVEGAPDDATFSVNGGGHHDFSGPATGHERGSFTVSFQVF